MNKNIKSLEKDKENLTKKNKDLNKEKEKLAGEKKKYEMKILQFEQKYQSDMEDMYYKNNSLAQSNINNEKNINIGNKISQSVNVNMNPKKINTLGNSFNPLALVGSDNIIEEEASSGGASINPNQKGSSGPKDSKVNNSLKEDENDEAAFEDDLGLGAEYEENDGEEDKDNKNTIPTFNKNFKVNNKKSLLQSSLNSNLFEFGKDKEKDEKERELIYELDKLIKEKNNLLDKLENSEGDKEEIQKRLEEVNKEYDEKNKELEDLKKY